MFQKQSLDIIKSVAKATWHDMCEILDRLDTPCYSSTS